MSLKTAKKNVMEEMLVWVSCGLTKVTMRNPFAIFLLPKIFINAGIAKKRYSVRRLPHAMKMSISMMILTFLFTNDLLNSKMHRKAKRK